MRPGVVGRTLGWRLASPAGVHPAVRVVATARSNRARRGCLGLNGRSPVGHQQTVAFDGPPHWAQGRCARIRRGQKWDSLRSRQHNAETRLSKELLVGLVTMILATSALAGERYIEVWNPPEARRSAANMMLILCETMHDHLQNRHSSAAEADERLRARCRES